MNFYPFIIVEYWSSKKERVGLNTLLKIRVFYSVASVTSFLINAKLKGHSTCISIPILSLFIEIKINQQIIHIGHFPFKMSSGQKLLGELQRSLSLGCVASGPQGFIFEVSGSGPGR